MKKILFWLVVVCIALEPVAITMVSAEKAVLSYGMAKKYLVKGETTQEKVLELFGAPNIVSKGSGKQEIWTYENVVSESSGVGGGIFGGGGAPVGNGGIGAAIGLSGRKDKSKSKTFTLVMKFNENEIVDDYYVRESNL